MTSDTLDRAWSLLGGVPVDLLTDDRVQLHHAAQTIASFGQTWVEAAPDDSHRGFFWDDQRRSMVSHRSPDDIRLRLEVPTLKLCIEEPGDEQTSFPLRGETLEAARLWLQAEMSDRGHAADVTWPEYDLPSHPVSAGAPLAPGSAGLDELAAWYHNAWLLLSDLVASHAPGALIRGWPHHFDLASLIEVSPAQGDRDASTIGIGFSPGDKATPAPYFYVNVWPYPDATLLPEVSGPGRWHTDGWIGAVLDGSELGTASSSQQAETAAQFFAARVNGARQALERADAASREQQGPR